jgi:hypothetical protein
MGAQLTTEVIMSYQPENIFLCVTSENESYRVCYAEGTNWVDLGTGDFVENVTGYNKIEQLSKDVEL